MKLKLKISKEEKHFIYALLKSVIVRIIAIILSWVVVYFTVLIGWIDVLWGMFFSIVLIINAFIFGRDYEKHIKIKKRIMSKINKINRYFIVAYEATVPNYRISGNIEIVSSGSYFQKQDVIDRVKSKHINAEDVVITFITELSREDIQEFLK